MNERNPSPIHLIFEISKVVRTLNFFEIEYKKRKKVYELNHKFQDV
jgi:hypothetical protein